MPIRLQFHGAARAVTGSCFALRTPDARVLIDCGLFQGAKSEKELNYRAWPFDVSDIDAVLLTHAHIDHSGLVPRLVKNGFGGHVFATSPTVDLCAVMLPDSGHIQEGEVEHLNRRNARRGKGPAAIVPIYTAADAVACLSRFRAVEYGAWVEAATGVRARFWNAGHLLGSASIEIEVAAAKGGAEAPMRLLFSGDIGPRHKLLQPDAEAPQGFDAVVCEGTYGDTDRGDSTPAQRRRRLRQEVTDALAAARRGGALIIPSFAVERTQELLVDLVGLMEAREIPFIPVHIDSPLATRASAVFERHAALMDEGGALVRALRSRHVRFVESVEQSKALDRMLNEFHIVIAASGMCEAGRIRYRLRNWLWRDEATVLFVGFQAQGTLGRILQDGAPVVRIQGDDIKVRARIRSLDLYSGHADGPELAAWAQGRLPIAGDLFLVHGEEPALAGLRERVSAFMPAARVRLPGLDETYELTKAGARPVEAPPPRLAADKPGHPDWHNEFSRLLLDVGQAVDKAADEKARGNVIRRIRRALDEISTDERAQ